MARGSRRDESGPEPIGISIVDKAAGWTSHDVVARGRGTFGTRKVGHSGTLDPDATGVLLLGVGRATRLLRYLTDLPKTYTTTVVLGIETSTLDDSGEVTATHDMGHVSAEEIEEIAATFVGDIEQIPPMVSAIKIDGKRLYELAREGIEVEREPRPVTIHSLVVNAIDLANLRFDIEVCCSSGTYIRTLAADIGTKLGGGAHLTNLRRTKVGSFHADQGLPIETAELISPAEGLRDYEAVEVDESTARDVTHGKVLLAEALGVSGAGPWRVLDADGQMLAMYESHRGDTVKPAVVLVIAT